MNFQLMNEVRIILQTVNIFLGNISVGGFQINFHDDQTAGGR